jgi:hypothetical protein
MIERAATGLQKIHFPRRKIDMPEITLDTLAGGAVRERVQRELDVLLANIADPNTDAKKARSLTLTIKLKPDINREIVDVEISAKASLVPAHAIETKLVTGRDHTGKVVGEELKSGVRGQMYMENDGSVRTDTGEPVPENVVGFNKIKAQGGK